MRVIQHLWFERDMEAAVRFYTALIPGSRLGWISALPDPAQGGRAGSVRLAEFTLGDQSYRAIEGGELDPFNHSFSIITVCDTQDEIDRLWAALGDGGTPQRCGWVRDRWGLHWQVVPARLGQLMDSATGEQAQRITAAMLKMKKFDIAGLEDAAAGPPARRSA